MNADTIGHKVYKWQDQQRKNKKTKKTPKTKKQ